MNIYTHVDYRSVLKEAMTQRRKFEPSATYQELARHMGVQKSYLSRVLKGQAELNQDQLFLAARYFSLDTEESDYLQLLLDHARCSIPERKKNLRAAIRTLQKKNLASETHLREASTLDALSQRQEYYLDPIHQIVHVCLTISRYQRDPWQLAQDLGLPRAKISRTLKTLVRLGLVALEGNDYRALEQSLHLSPDHPIYPAWCTQLRTLASARQQQLAADDSYSFSVVFSSSPKTKRAIQARFLEMLKDIESLVKADESRECFQMNFDLFRWTLGA